LYSFVYLTATDLFPLSYSISEIDQGPGCAQENEYSKSRYKLHARRTYNQT